MKQHAEMCEGVEKSVIEQGILWKKTVGNDLTPVGKSSIVKEKQGELCWLAFPGWVPRTPWLEDDSMNSYSSAVQCGMYRIHLSSAAHQMMADGAFVYEKWTEGSKQ